MINKLKQHSALHKVDGTCRDRLVPILLSPSHILDYLKEEKLFKQELKSDSALDDDLQSITSVNEVLTEEQEQKSLTWLLEQMELYHGVVRKLCNRTHQFSSLLSTSKPPVTGTVPKQLQNSKSRGNSSNFSPTNPPSSSQTQYKCVLCEIPHIDKQGNSLLSLSRCQNFRGMDAKARINLVKSFNFCP